MSSMRNAVARRPHRERAQPLERRRLGLLEKHKDYSLRAKDFNKKKAQLKNLKEKAAERNEDEFYFGMMSRKGPGSKIQDGKRWSGTVEGDRGNKAMDVETVRLLKTQDIGYIRTMRQVVAKEVARLEEQVVLTRGFDKLDEDEDEDDEDEGSDSEFDFATAPSRPKEPRKIVFMDDEEQREETILDLEDEVDADKTFEGFDDDKKKEAEFERAKALRCLRRQLENARKKLKALTDAEGELEIQRAKMAKTATSGGTTRKGKKIMVRTRKR
ncbi:Putative U3 small nucleolar RNA-associated protein 11 [Fusarium oxysporum f. sp. cubense race 1]|uniref:U3 small nucleolar RNA-associated protein 11 n=1 Tax=Fusarium oxysporum f. sp. cubense (strain race 1) TaxID=1229664 RepID=N4U0J3_FUSC1|nr:Putative U3 small nucleolar RNA-associated protein 11 [Fusarium oxysporum f. sp. cubense race 1]